MRLLFVSLFVLLAAVTLAMLARNDPGYLMINYHDWAIETSLVLAIVVIMLFFVVLYTALRFFVTTRRVPRKLGSWRRKRRGDRAADALNSGLLELAKGEWGRAEKHLTKHIAHSKTPLLNYLGAARAAQKQGDDERRDRYLKLAHQSMPKAELAIALTQAELQISHGQMEQALATLSQLRQSSPKHVTVMKLLMRLYVELHDWERLLELLPALIRRKLVDHEEAQRLQTLAYAGLLKRAARETDRMAIHSTWRRIPKTIRQQESMLVDYIQDLISHGESADAVELIQQALNKHWSDRLAYLYGFVEADAVKQIRHAEAWLKNHGSNAIVLLTLGRLCKRKQLWTQAQQYLESSLGLVSQAETYRELAQLLEQMGEHDKALQYYREGLMAVQVVANDSLTLDFKPAQVPVSLS